MNNNINKYTSWFVLAQRPTGISIVEPDVYSQWGDSFQCGYIAGGYKSI
ncbi:MAG: hypothetical protein HDT30_08435 [Clostridiales bacterium]|nr:hypothetical protein [Clostridiales bacterium]